MDKSTLPEDMRERANTLYRPDLTDLELNEYQGKERLVVYLDDVITLLEDTDRKARTKGETEVLTGMSRWCKKYHPELVTELQEAISYVAASLQSPSKESK